MIYVMSGGANLSSAELFAVIAVTYPEGSICTCGGKAAKDTSGYALFPVKAGTYTVECHTSDNGQSASKSVTITTQGQGEKIELSYDLILYKNGVFSAESGDWVSLLRATINKYDGYFEIVKSSSDYVNRSGFENAIDLTEYSSLEITCMRRGTGYGGVLKFGVTDSRMSSSVEMGSNYVGIPNPGQDSWTSVATYSLNIENINKTQYIGIDGKDFDLRVYSIILKR